MVTHTASPTHRDGRPTLWQLRKLDPPTPPFPNPLYILGAHCPSRGCYGLRLPETDGFTPCLCLRPRVPRYLRGDKPAPGE